MQEGRLLLLQDMGNAHFDWWLWMLVSPPEQGRKEGKVYRRRQQQELVAFHYLLSPLPNVARDEGVILIPFEDIPLFIVFDGSE